MIGLATFEEEINDQHWRKLHTVQYTNEIMQNEISIHLDLGPEEVGRSLHVWPGLPRNVPQHDVMANVQLIPQGAVEVPDMAQIISKGIQTGRHVNQMVNPFRRESSPRNLIIPRHSVGTPPDEDGVTVQAEGALEGQAKESKAEGESSAGEQPSLVLGVQVYHELGERVQARNVHQNPRKLLFQTTKEERSILRL